MSLNADSKPKAQVSRRDFLKLLPVAGLGLFFAEYAARLEPDWVEVTQVALQLPRLPKAFSGFRLAQVSDIHLGGWMNLERLNQVFELVAAQKPDLVALTGDFVLDPEREPALNLDLEAYAGSLKWLTKRFPTLAVLGNHDYWLDVQAVLGLLKQSGVRTLVNSAQAVQVGSETIWFGGVDDVSEGEDDLDQVLAQLPTEGCAILLAHEPDFADESAPSGRFDLQISGHSHGGQVNLPFLGPPVLPHLAHKYPVGLYRVGTMYQYTNRGVGMTPPYVRFNCRPEITIFTLESA
jgi:predicted MPP superfamily phosphohydrolase